MNCVLTIAIGEAFQQLAAITTPRMKRYASSIGAEFILHTQQKVSKAYPYYEKFVIHELLDKYERIIFFDLDILVRRSCTNLFALVPETSLGMYDESLLANDVQRQAHKEVIDKASREFLGHGLKLFKHFYNTGVIVASKLHKDIFAPPVREMFSNYWDQSYLNAVISDRNIDVFDIGYRHNRMPYIESVVKEHRLNADIIHYAGIPDLSIVQYDALILDAIERNPHYFV